MDALIIKNLSMDYDGVPALRDVTLTINPGEFFSLLGPSGCGKSTTLRLIAGFLQPTAGTIHLGEKNLTPLPPEKRDTGMVFQNYALFPHMTVYENIAFGLKARKMEKTVIRAKVARALDQVNLTGLGDRPVPELSGGQQQRVALARALAIEPRVLLLDEPLSNLDAKLREETREQLIALQRRLELITIYVTHDQEEALQLSSRLVVMFDGRCHQVGTPAEIYGAPAGSRVADFVGRSQVFDGVITRVEGRKIAITIGDDWALRSLLGDDAPSPRNGDAVRVAIRPEAIRPAAGEHENTFEALVTERRFHGAYWIYTLIVGGAPVRCMELNRSLHPMAVGDRSVFHVAPHQVLLIPK